MMTLEKCQWIGFERENLHRKPMITKNFGIFCRFTLIFQSKTTLFWSQRFGHPHIQTGFLLPGTDRAWGKGLARFPF